MTSSFEQLNVDPATKAQFAEKLEKYITDKEQAVLAINKKKTSQRTAGEFPKIKSATDLHRLKKFVKEVRKSSTGTEGVEV